MRCRSCSENIDSKYRYALANNVCPVCGQKLLSDALFNFRIKVTHILETHEVSPDNIDVISTEIMNTIIRSFIEDKQQPGAIQPTPDQKRALASTDRKLVKFGDKKEPSEETSTEDFAALAAAEVRGDDREYAEDDPNNPENKEFLNEMGWSEEALANMKDAKKPPVNPLLKKIPSPISRLS